MICQKCGSKNKSTSKFCSSCGMDLAVAHDDARICSACGWSNEKAAKFCGECGHHLHGPEHICAGSAEASAHPGHHVPAFRGVVQETLARSDEQAVRAVMAARASAAAVSTAANPVATSVQPVEAAAGVAVLESTQPAIESLASAVAPAAPSQAEIPSHRRRPHTEAETPQAITVPGRRSLPAILAVVIVLALALGGWWFMRPAAQPAAGGTSAQPGAVPTDTSVPKNATQSPASKLTGTASVKSDEPEAPAVAAQPANAAADKDAEEKKRAAEHAKRKAAEEQRRKKADEAKAQAPKEARVAQRPAEQNPKRAEKDSHQSKSLTTQEQVEQCQSMNFFKREMCMFRACNNKWGHDGCPAYSSNQTQNY